MRKTTIITLIVIIFMSNSVLANNIPDKPFKFKDNISSEILKRSQYNPITPKNIPSMSTYVENILNKNKTLPEIAYKAPQESINNVAREEFSTNPPSPHLKSTNIKYNSDYSTDDYVYTGYTFNNGLIFPIDLRENRNAGITTGTKSKSTNHKGLRTTSTVGYRTLSELEWHTGLDLSGGIGENGGRSTHNLYAPIDSKVIYAGSGEKGSGVGGYGNSVVLEFSIGNNTYRCHFAHMSTISSKVKNGQIVKQGQYLGRIGSTGYSTGNHLHWNLSSANSYKNKLGFPQPWSKSIFGYTNNWNNYGDEFKIYDPTYLYGNIGTGKPYEQFFDKINIINFSGSSEIQLNSKSGYYQAPYNYSKKNSSKVELPNKKIHNIIKPNGKW